MERATTLQAASTVLLSSLATGIGLAAWRGLSSTQVPIVCAIALVSWSAWAVLIHQIGTRMFPDSTTRSNLGELLRTTGFAAGPGLLQIFEVIRPIAMPVFIVTTLWMFAGVVVAVQHALDYRRTSRALFVCAFAALCCLVMGVAVAMLFSVEVS
jgi:hypothetical protein